MVGQERQAVVEPGRSTPVLGAYETVVVGGGPAGIAAAVASARAGRTTLLIERYGFLGGAGTAAGLSTFCGLHANIHGEQRQVVHGIADEILSRLDRMGGLAAPHLSFQNRIAAQAYDMAAYKIAADEMLLAAGVRLLFHALAVGVAMRSESRIEAVFVETKSGRKAICGEMFIDCSGDGDLAAWAGAPYEKGDGHGGMLYPSTMFRIAGIDPERAGRAWETIPALMEEAEARGDRRFPRRHPIVRPQKNPTEWRANVTQVRNPDDSAVDGTDVEQMTFGEIEGRRQVHEVFDFLKRTAPGFDRAYIVEIAAQLGIRETRRILGAYQLSEADILGCVDFPDAIGVNGWPVERHQLGEVLVKFQGVPETRGFNQLPFRMIVPRRIDNLYVAGRCASMTHDGQSSARVSGPCFVMGEAAGTAAAMALESGRAAGAIDVAALQERLETAGVYLGRTW